jgi:molybdate transport system regulatory protein
MASGNIPRLVAVLKQRAGEEKRLPCAEAFKIARDLEIPVGEVGKAANELGIKIVHCQLGCF